MFKIFAGLFATTLKMEAEKFNPVLDDAVRKPTDTAVAVAPERPISDDETAIAAAANSKPKRLSDVSQMRLAAYVERTGNTE